MEDQEQLNSERSNKPLEVRDKLYFGMVWWGMHSWGSASEFKEKGYTRKYREARQAMYTGMFIYGTGVLVFILFLLR